LDEKEVLFISFKANLFSFAGRRYVSMLKKKNKKFKKTSNFSDRRTVQEKGERLIS
jgi:predicted transcriptional regulator